MDYLYHFIDFFVHLDVHLNELVANYGTYAYIILFLIVFCETGLVVTPFLPGDSMLFVIGAICALGALNLELVLVLLIVAAILGDTVNYHAGKFIGPKAFRNENSKLLKKEYLDKTNAFYEKHGGKTIIFARFVPIVRTFAPFVAGVGKMNYSKFISYNVVGGVAWIVSFTMAGYFFGNMPWVKKYFTIVVFGIIFISILPGIISYLKNKFNKNAKTV